MPTESLWPTHIGSGAIPAPAKILQEQGDFLSEQTEGILYGEVVQSRFHSIDKVMFDFFLCIRKKNTRHKLISIECSLLFEFEVAITNHEASSVVQVHERQEFVENIGRIFTSVATQEILARLLALARE